jgi:WD40 repeat protein
VYPLDNVTCLDTPTLIRSFDASQNGTTLAVAGHDGLSIVRLDGAWSIADKREEGQFILASLSPDGQRLAAVNKLDDTLFIWDVGTLQTVHQLTHRSADDLTTLAWSSMGSFIAVGGRNGKVVVWDAQFAEAILEFEL